jgi:MFS family permease
MTADLRLADRHSRFAALTLGMALPTDVLLYLLLPMYASDFGLSLAEVGVLLAANRLVRIVGYGAVSRFYGRHGDRLTSTLAVVTAGICALGYTTLSGVWVLLPLRLMWGLAFAALNLSSQVQATAQPLGVARRSGRARAFTALGPMIALPTGAAVALWLGPRPIFFALSLVAFAGLLMARRLPMQPHALTTRRGIRLPSRLDFWSFLEGLTLDGLFIIGLSYLGKDLFPGGAVMAAALLMALRYLGELLLSPVGGHLAEKYGAQKLLVSLSLLTSVSLVGFGAGWLWSCAAAIVVLRALQLPLVAPLVTQRNPGPERVQALAANSVWRDIGAGAGPLLAGALLPIVPSVWMYGVAALLLAMSAVLSVLPSTTKSKTRG